MPAPRTATGTPAQSAARSADVTTIATPPSVGREQSSSRSGSTMSRDAWWSATVIGSPYPTAPYRTLP
ncbi:hypothetical protein [Actinomadura sp. LOL_011]|uniref:hypothetical protein n=1 Tax=Actinomadura sp. LOL_011 TaxID=3345410 RepID=UPI003A808B15